MEVSMKEIAPGVFVESSYPPYNLVLIVTSEGGIVVDLPPNPVHTFNWLEQARAVANSLRYVVITDAKRERQLATAACSVPIIATTAVLRAMAVYSEERARREFAEALSFQYPEEVATLNRLLPHAPAIAFDDSFTFYTEERILRFESIAGSAPGSLWVVIADQELLVAGDTVVDDTVPSLDTTPDSKAWLNTMSALAHRHTVRSIVPGRGRPVITNGDIEPQREFIRVMRRAARTLLRRGANGMSMSQTAQELGQTFFNRQGQKAVKEIKAGLEHLVAEFASEDAARDENEGVMAGREPSGGAPA
jgi:glyoxylase-like metal-dependent hydrolase (beta-lactamase superfamily II)